MKNLHSPIFLIIFVLFSIHSFAQPDPTEPPPAPSPRPAPSGPVPGNPPNPQPPSAPIPLPPPPIIRLKANDLNLYDVAVGYYSGSSNNKIIKQGYFLPRNRKRFC
jgi:hypothetical protein